MSLEFGKNEFNDEDEPIPMLFAPDAKKLLYDWQSDNIEKWNKGSDIQQGIYSKLEAYLPRIAMILQLLHNVCNEAERKNIELFAVEKAIDLIEYFRNTAERVYNQVLGNKAVDNLEGAEKLFYEGLKKEFETKDAMKLCAKLKIDDRTAYRYLDNSYLYVNLKKGYYEKIIFD